MSGGQCFTKENRPKRRYPSRRAAKRARLDLIDIHDGSDPGRPYRCPQCDWFHLGHYPTSPAIRDSFRRRHRKAGER